MNRIKNQYIKELSKSLAQAGKELIEEAYYNRDFNNKTYNLHDSYGSCLFYNGKEISGTRRYIGKVATERKMDKDGKMVMGREELDKFFDTYKTSYKGFELVMAVAIFYAQELEKGIGIRRKYRVISGMNGELLTMSKKLNARIVNINI